MPPLRCCLRHWCAFEDAYAITSTRRLSSVSSLHRVAQNQGLDALRGIIVAGVRGEHVLEAAYLPIGAALFQDDMPAEFVLQHLCGDSGESRSAAIFASIYYSSSALSIEIAERTITNTGSRLTLQAMKEALDLKNRSTTSGTCDRCGARGVQVQHPLDWLPNYTL